MTIQSEKAVAREKNNRESVKLSQFEEILLTQHPTQSIIFVY